MVVKAQARGFRILVDGLDVSLLVTYLQVGDSKIARDGLILTKGSLRLNADYSFSESLDPRRNPRFTRGAKVEVWIDTLSGNERRHPRGALRIHTDPKPPTLKNPYLEIDLCDLLGLFDFPQPAGDKSGVELGTARQASEIISTILEGIAFPSPNFHGDTAVLDVYPLNYELPKLKDGFVNQCGKIAFARRCALWIDNQERLRVTSFDVEAFTAFGLTVQIGDRIGNELFYDPIEDYQFPYQRYHLSGTTIDVGDNENPKCTFFRRYGKKGDIDPRLMPNDDDPGVGIPSHTWKEVICVSEEEICVEWQENKKITTKKLKEPKGAFHLGARFDGSNFDLIDSQESIETEEYNEDKLLIKKSLLVKACRAKARPQQFPPPAEEEDTGGVDISNSSRVLAWIPSEDTVEECFYDDDQVLQEWKRTQKLPYGAVLARTLMKEETTETPPAEGEEPAEGEVGATLPPDTLLDKLIDTQQEYRRWEELKQDEWAFLQEVKRPRAVIVDDWRSLPKSTYTHMIIDNDKDATFLNIANNGDTNPPDAITLNNERDRKEKHLEAICEIEAAANAQYRQQVDEIQVEYAVSDQQLEELGWAIAALDQGRIFAYELGTDIPDSFLDDGYNPLFKVRLTEAPVTPGAKRSVFGYLAESGSFVCAEDQAMMSVDLILLGYMGEDPKIAPLEILKPSPSPSPTPEPTPTPTPTPTPEPEPEPPTEIIQPVAPRLVRLGFGMGMGFKVTNLPYSLITSPLTLNFGTGMGLAHYSFIAEPTTIDLGLGLGLEILGTDQIITRTVTITANGTAYSNYPLLISFDASSALPNGADIRAFDSDGVTPLSIFLEPYSTVNLSSLEMVVLVPSVPSSGTKEIFVEYANGETVSVSSASAIAPELTTSSTQLWFCSSDLALANNNPAQTLSARAGITLSQATLAKQATFRTAQLGSRPALDFLDDDTYSSLITTSGTASIFTIAKFRSMSTEGLICAYGIQDDGNNNLGWSFGRDYRGDFFGLVNPGVGWADTAPYSLDWSLFELNINNSGTTELFRNRSLILSKTYAANLQSRFVLGGITPNAGYFKGLLYEIAVINNCSTSSKTRMNLYLSQKAGIGSLPSVIVGGET